MVRVISDVSIVNDNFLMSIFKIIRSMISIGIFVIIAMYYDTHLFLVSLVIIPLFTFAVTSVGNKIKKNAIRLQLNSADIFANVEEVLNNIRIVKAFCKEGFELKRFKKKSAKYKNSWSRGRVYNSWNVPITEMNSAITGDIILLIGGAIVSKPQILLFDEATSALDTESEFRVQEAIERVSGDRTVVLIAHRLSTVLSSDKIIALDNGEVVGVGNHEQLLRNCTRYRELYQLQLR